MADDDTPASEPRTSARDRRRERAASKGSDKAGRTFKRYRVHAAIIVIFGAIVAVMAVQGGQGPNCPGHWHSSQDVFVHGERISFNHAKFTLEGGQGMPVSSHLHRGDDSMWHWEPSTAETCVPYGDALRFVDMELGNNRLALDGAHAELGQAGTYTNGDNGTLKVEHKVGEGEWETISVGALLDRQMRADERVLIHFDNETVSSQQLATMRSTAESHSIQSSSAGTGSYVPAIGVGILGLVVLGAWHALSKKA